jgi:hypothetical protein
MPVRDAMHQPNLRHFPLFLVIDLRDQTGWLGREVRMAESKSEYFAFEIKAHSEK